MSLKTNISSMGTQSGNLTPSAHSDRYNLLLPCCVSVKTKRPTRKRLPILLFCLGMEFTCPGCRRKYEVVYFHGGRYTIQWTE
jgi:hypothetical protein